MDKQTLQLEDLGKMNREEIEFRLVEFDQQWNDTLLADTACQLHDTESTYRIATLAEMVKIDMEHRRQQGDLCVTESYLEQFPEIGNCESSLVGLLHAEYRVRRQFGDPSDINQFASRFPRQTDRLRELIADESISLKRHEEVGDLLLHVAAGPLRC